MMSFKQLTNRRRLASRTPWLLGLTALTLAMSAGTASAQYAPAASRTSSNPFGRNRSYMAPRSALSNRPTFSPYLNLLRQGDPVLNYYGLVRPEQEFRAANEQFRAEFGEVQQHFDALEQREAAS